MNHSNKLSRQIDQFRSIELNVAANLLNAMPPLPLSWRINCLQNINKFPKWKILHKTIPNRDIHHFFYNSDFQIHKWDNKFWGKLFNRQWFLFLLLAFSVSDSIIVSPKNWALFWSLGKFNSNTTKMNYSFLLPLPFDHGKHCISGLMWLNYNPLFCYYPHSSLTGFF